MPSCFLQGAATLQQLPLSEGMNTQQRMKRIVFLIALYASAIVNAENQIASVFPHQKGKHPTVACASCHVLIGASFEVKSVPNHAACASCHNYADEAVDHFASFCGICHRATPESSEDPQLFPLSARPHEFQSLFLHKAHLQSRPGAQPSCFDCHTFQKDTAITRADHKACFACHTDKPTPAPSREDCKECHQKLIPWTPETSQNFKHSDHVYDTRPVRKQELAGRKSDYLCSECHLPIWSATQMHQRSWQNGEYCSRCHNGKPGLPEKLKS